MKWIGQNIYDQISRFRGDVFFETNNVTFTSAEADQPLVTIKNTSNDTNDMARLNFVKDRGAAPAVGTNLAEIRFMGEDSGQNEQQYGLLLSEIDVATSGQESGILKLGVANHDGGNGYGLTLTGGSVDAEVDVILGLGAASVTDVLGTLSMGGTAAMTNAGLLSVGGQTNITSVGTLSTLVVDSPSNLGAPGIKLTNQDADQTALDINADNTTANIIDISAVKLTTGNAISIDSNTAVNEIKIDKDFDGTGDFDGAMVDLDFTKGIGITTIASRSCSMVGIKSVVSDLGRNDGGATNDITNLSLTSNRSYADGAVSVIGISNVVTGVSDAGSVGYFSNVTNTLGPDFKMVSSANTDDHCLFGTGVDGATSLVTVDADASSAHFTLNIDGGFIVSSTGIDIAVDGTITNATWNGTAIASAYLDADTAHLSGSQTFTGTKTLNSFKGTGGTTVTNILDEDAMGSDSATALATQQSIKAYTTATHATAQTGKGYRVLNANFRDDIATTKHYLPMKGILEQLNLQREEVSELAVTDGRVVSITLRVENLNTGASDQDSEITFGIETNVAGVDYDNTGGGGGSAWSVIETEALTVNNQDDDHVFHYVFAEAKHWDSTDMWAVSIESDTDMSGTNERFFVTVVVEDDWSTYLAGSSRELTTTP